MATNSGNGNSGGRDARRSLRAVGGRMIETTFHNVTITIEAESPAAAYTALCNALGGIPLACEWETDEYSADGPADCCCGCGMKVVVRRPTSELWPVDGDGGDHASD